MILSRPVYNTSGNLLFDTGATLSGDDLTRLNSYGIGELLIDDPRVADVPVHALVAPEVEADATHALRTLIGKSRSSGELDDTLLVQAERPLANMTRGLFPEILGEVNATGSQSLESYEFVQPIKAAALALLIGRRLGFGMTKLTALGTSTILMNIGNIVMPQSLLRKRDPLTETEQQALMRHPQIGGELLKRTGHVNREIIEGVEQHHERWDGSGYPSQLKGEAISITARIIAIADTFYELVSLRPDRKPYMPHEAVEYIMAYSGELFDPNLVSIFSRQVPLYPTGVTVMLNTGEMAIITNANLGHVGRPVVRVCTDEKGRPLRDTYDLDLCVMENQSRLVARVMDY